LTTRTTRTGSAAVERVERVERVVVAGDMMILGGLGGKVDGRRALEE